jgi:hypothetical protein
MTKITFGATASLIICLLSFTPASAANDNPENDLPEGMELRSIDSKPGYKVVVPKGTTISKVGDLRVIEGSGEYAARKLAEFDERFVQMSAEIEALKQELDQVKKDIGKNQ